MPTPAKSKLLSLDWERGQALDPSQAPTPRSSGPATPQERHRDQQPSRRGQSLTPGLVRRRGGRTGIANLFWCQRRQDVAQELANAVVRGPLGWLRGRMEEVRRRLSDLPGAVLSIEKEGYRITLSPQQSKTDWTAEIRHIMRLLQEDRTERHPVGTRSRPGAHSCCRSTPRPRPRFWSSSTGPDVVTGEGPVGPLSHRHQTRSPGGWSIERSHQPQPPRPGAGPAWMDGPGPGPSLGDQRGHHFGRASGSPSEAELDPPHGERATQGPRAGGSC